MIKKIQSLLGAEADDLLKHKCKGFSKESLNLPGPDFIDRVWVISDRTPGVLRCLASLFDHGRLAGTGYLSILPVDQGIEHSAGASFAPTPSTSTRRTSSSWPSRAAATRWPPPWACWASVARKYAHKIPFIVKINHNEMLTYPNIYDQTLFARWSRPSTWARWRWGPPSTSAPPECRRQIQEISEAFELAHELGMATILWCYLRNPAFKTRTGTIHAAADLTGQANHLGVTIEADIIKQKLPENNGGYKAVKFGKTSELVYSKLSRDHPIDLSRYQVANCYMGRVGLINSGGGSGENDLADAVRTAVINKRAGGMGLISGRKTFQRPMKEGVELFNAIQDVYLCKEVTVA